MEHRNLEKALELISDLIQGEENPLLYEEYISNSEVYRLTGMIAKKMGLNIYEYQNHLYKYHCTQASEYTATHNLTH